MRFRSFGILLPCALLLWNCGDSKVSAKTQADTSLADREVTLRLNVPKGQAFDSRFVVDTEAGGEKIAATVDVVGKVLSTSENRMEMSYKVTAAKVDAGANRPNPFDAILNKEFTMVLDSRGRVIESKGAPDGFDLQRESGVILPEDPVTIGSKWKETETQDGMELTSSYEVVGFEKVNGRDAAKLAVSISAPSANMVGRGNTWIDLEWGLQVKGDIDSSFSIMGQTVKMSMQAETKAR